MTREEARIYWIGRYEAARKWDDPHWEASERKEHRRYVDALNAAIKALSSAEAEWIPCSERLPGKNQEVLLQCHHNMIVGYWMDGDFDGEKEWRVLSGDGWESGCDFPNDVFEPLAWMPLPKPWKGADDE